jgi:large conductance mechanosensitive channel
MASNLSYGHFDSLAAAKAAPAATINCGVLMNTVINLLIVAFAIFLLVRRGKRVAAAHLGRDTLSPSSP